jgi:SAM-dependent methyltransferase
MDADMDDRSHPRPESPGATDQPPLAATHHAACATAYVRGALGLPADQPVDARALAAAHGLRLHPFKRTAGLPRVQKMLGVVYGVWPESLLDVGPGRGVFLWPLLEAFPGLRVHARDLLERRIARIDAVARGGFPGLTAAVGDVTRLDDPDDAHDVVTALEVLEHVPDVARAVTEVVRVARRWVLISVPSHADDNPGHLHLLTRERITALTRAAGAGRAVFDHVPGHLLAVVPARPRRARHEDPPHA